MVDDEEGEEEETSEDAGSSISCGLWLGIGAFGHNIGARCCFHPVNVSPGMEQFITTLDTGQNITLYHGILIIFGEICILLWLGFVVIVLNVFRSCYLNQWFCKFSIYFSKYFRPLGSWSALVKSTS